MLTQLFFLLLSLGSGFMGFLVFGQAKSAIHEIEAFILFLIAAIFLSALGLLSKGDEIVKELKRHKRG